MNTSKRVEKLEAVERIVRQHLNFAPLPQAKECIITVAPAPLRKLQKLLSELDDDAKIQP